MLISNRNSFRVLFDKLLPCVLFEKNIFYGQPGESALCQLYRHSVVSMFDVRVCRVNGVDVSAEGYGLDVSLRLGLEFVARIIRIR